MQPYVGGSFAPPLSDAAIAGCKQLANQAPPQIGDAMRVLIGCVEKWWALPDSKGMGLPHASGTGIVIPLDEPIKQALDPHIPWGPEGVVDELAMFGQLFDSIDPVEGKELRNAAFHLLWHVKELDLNREPMTTDRL